MTQLKNLLYFYSNPLTKVIKMNLKPAHEAIIEGIKTHFDNLIKIEKTASENNKYENLRRASFETGGLCSLTEALGKMIIPADRLNETIEELKKIPYRHLIIGETIRNLMKRKY